MCGPWRLAALLASKDEVDPKMERARARLGLERAVASRADIAADFVRELIDANGKEEATHTMPTAQCALSTPCH